MVAKKIAPLRCAALHQSHATCDMAFVCRPQAMTLVRNVCLRWRPTTSCWSTRMVTRTSARCRRGVSQQGLSVAVGGGQVVLTWPRRRQLCSPLPRGSISPDFAFFVCPAMKLSCSRWTSRCTDSRVCSAPPVVLRLAASPGDHQMLLPRRARSWQGMRHVLRAPTVRRGIAASVSASALTAKRA